MATTAIFAELLIVGFETATWLLLLVLAITGPGSMPLSDLRGWEALATLVVVAAAYPLGVVSDRLADDFRFLIDRKWPGRPVDRPTSITTMRLAVLRQGGDLSAFLIYQRSRMRLARATVINLVISCPVALLFLASWHLLRWQLLAIPLILALLAFACLVAYRRLDFVYVDWLSQAYRFLTDPTQAADSASKQDAVEIAAAIPYCVLDDHFKFLLVRTKAKDGVKAERWTFPKGHRRDKETLPEAARREAKEEGGIDGVIESQRLTDFLYFNPVDSEQPDRVAAFLLKIPSVQIEDPEHKGKYKRECPEPDVKTEHPEGKRNWQWKWRRKPNRTQSTDQEKREPRWVCPTTARTLLANEREAQYASELQRVARLAERHITASELHG